MWAGEIMTSLLKPGMVQWTPTLINCYIDSDVLPMSFLTNY